MNRLTRWIVWRLPHSVVRWAFFRMTAFATSGRWGNSSPLGMSWETIAQRWDKGDGPCCVHADATCDESCDCDEWCCPPLPPTEGYNPTMVR